MAVPAIAYLLARAFHIEGHSRLILLVLSTALSALSALSLAVVIALYT